MCCAPNVYMFVYILIGAPIVLLTKPGTLRNILVQAKNRQKKYEMKDMMDIMMEALDYVERSVLRTSCTPERRNVVNDFRREPYRTNKRSS